MLIEKGILALRITGQSGNRAFYVDERESYGLVLFHFLILKIFMLQAQGGRLSFILSSPCSEDELAETKTSGELLAYVSGSHEYVLLNPYGEQDSKLNISRQRNYSSVDETGDLFFWYRMLFPQLQLSVCLRNIYLMDENCVPHFVR